MCGIVGYVGKRGATRVVLNGLRWLLPRGYDSAGVSVIEHGYVVVEKAVLKDGNFEQFVHHVLEGYIFDEDTNAIAHLRWATHGEKTDVNAHPHTDQFKKISVVHNGIIENHRELRAQLKEAGYVIASETDSELVAHLFAHQLTKSAGNMRTAIVETVKRLQGTFGLLLQHADHPSMLIGVRFGAPLSYMSFGDGSFMVASTAEPFLEHGNHCKHLADGQIIIIENGTVEEFSFDDSTVEIPEVEFEGSAADILKEGFPHYMLKEIMTQVSRLLDVLRGRVFSGACDVKLGGLEGVMTQLLKAKHIFLLGSGTSNHAAEIIARMFRNYLNVHAEAKLASEIVADNVLAGCDPQETVVFFISQSGETADLIAALKEMRIRNVSLCLGIVNVVGSTIARETDAGVYLHVGNELGVASTKAFSAQVMVGAMICILLARAKGMSQELASDFIQELCLIPEKIGIVLKQADKIKRIAESIKDKPGVMVLGRGYHFASAREGALKIIEVGYMWREVQPAGEMKHGPIAIIEDGTNGTEQTPVVIIATKGNLRTHIASNLSEIKARGAYVIGICTEGDSEMIENMDEYLVVPDVRPELCPILAVVVLQLLAYYLGVARGANVDQPKNLAKAVTVL